MRPSSRLKDLELGLSVWKPREASALTWLLPELREMLAAEFAGAYQPMITERGWSLEFMLGAGEHAPDNIRSFRELVERFPASDEFLGYDPYVVGLEQRSRALLFRDLPAKSVASFATLLDAVGVGGQDQLRVLVCDGPRLLSWLGATRREPFTRRELSILQRLTKPIQRRLRLERQLRSSWPRHLATEAALEALGRPAFIVGPRGSIEMTNRPGALLLERDAKGVLGSIRESEGRESDAPFAITCFSAPGYPAYVLAIQNETRPTLATRVSLAQSRWGLTGRQTRVLEWIGTGASNKDIAGQLGCAKVTVENHITELYRRSGARSRADLVQRLFLLT
jgi:DNA-binding CsgD family transcriptional regulator